MVCCLHQMILSRRDKVEGECGRAECVCLAKLIVTRKGVCVVVVKKVTLLKIATWCFVFVTLTHTLHLRRTPSDQAKRFAECQFILASGKLNRAPLALPFTDKSGASAAGARLVLLLTHEAVLDTAHCTADIQLDFFYCFLFPLKQSVVTQKVGRKNVTAARYHVHSRSCTLLFCSVCHHFAV